MWKKGVMAEKTTNKSGSVTRQDGALVISHLQIEKTKETLFGLKIQKGKKKIFLILQFAKTKSIQAIVSIHRDSPSVVQIILGK